MGLILLTCQTALWPHPGAADESQKGILPHTKGWFALIWIRRPMLDGSACKLSTVWREFLGANRTTYAPELPNPFSARAESSSDSTVLT
jgi:hypothetical protein